MTQMCREVLDYARPRPPARLPLDVVQIVRQMSREDVPSRVLIRRPVLGGLLAGFVVMYVTGMLVG